MQQSAHRAKAPGRQKSGRNPFPKKKPPLADGGGPFIQPAVHNLGSGKLRRMAAVLLGPNLLRLAVRFGASAFPLARLNLVVISCVGLQVLDPDGVRSEENTSELQLHSFISY